MLLLMMLQYWSNQTFSFREFEKYGKLSNIGELMVVFKCGLCKINNSHYRDSFHKNTTCWNVFSKCIEPVSMSIMCVLPCMETLVQCMPFYCDFEEMNEMRTQLIKSHPSMINVFYKALRNHTATSIADNKTIFRLWKIIDWLLDGSSLMQQYWSDIDGSITWTLTVFEDFINHREKKYPNLSVEVFGLVTRILRWFRNEVSCHSAIIELIRKSLSLPDFCQELAYVCHLMSDLARGNSALENNIRMMVQTPSIAFRLVNLVVDKRVYDKENFRVCKAIEELMPEDWTTVLTRQVVSDVFYQFHEVFRNGVLRESSLIAIPYISFLTKSIDCLKTVEITLIPSEVEHYAITLICMLRMYSNDEEMVILTIRLIAELNGIFPNILYSYWKEDICLEVLQEIICQYYTNIEIWVNNAVDLFQGIPEDIVPLRNVDESFVDIWVTIIDHFQHERNIIDHLFRELRLLSKLGVLHKLCQTELFWKLAFEFLYNWNDSAIFIDVCQNLVSCPITDRVQIVQWLQLPSIMTKIGSLYGLVNIIRFAHDYTMLEVTLELVNKLVCDDQLLIEQLCFWFYQHAQVNERIFTLLITTFIQLFDVSNSFRNMLLSDRYIMQVSKQYLLVQTFSKMTIIGLMGWMNKVLSFMQPCLLEWNQIQNNVVFWLQQYGEDAELLSSLIFFFFHTLNNSVSWESNKLETIITRLVSVGLKIDSFVFEQLLQILTLSLHVVTYRRLFHCC